MIKAEVLQNNKKIKSNSIESVYFTVKFWSVDFTKF